MIVALDSVVDRLHGVEIEKGFEEINAEYAKG
jgi:hypothetical protein